MLQIQIDHSTVLPVNPSDPLCLLTELVFVARWTKPLGELRELLREDTPLVEVSGGRHDGTLCIIKQVTKNAKDEVWLLIAPVLGSAFCEEAEDFEYE